MTSTTARFDLVRVALVGLVAVMALVTAYLDANDLWRSFQDVVVPYFVTAGIVAITLALMPGSVPWSYDRRALTAIAAIVWAVTALPVLLFALAASGCACSSGGPNYVPPTILGFGTPSFVFATLVGGPMLLLFAATSGPDRLRRRWTRPH